MGQRAHGHADAYFAGPFRDGHEHDVHDADSADDETDARDGPKHDADDVLKHGELGDEFLLGLDLEVILLAGADFVSGAE